MSEEPLKPGDTFDRYTIEALLGEGGMSAVYAALDTRLHRRVALKLLRLERLSPDGAPDVGADATIRLVREARAVAALDHPNVVSVFDAGEADGQPYLTMELIDGRSMRSVVRDPSVPWRTRLRWMLDVARALGAAHERGLVHRDIKPENIMVRQDGVVKVLDFGIARRLELGPMTPTTGGGLPTLTGGGNIVGTPYYMAPEQMRGEALDGRADQFAWAVVTYEALTDKLPWDRSGDPLKVVAELLSKDPPPPEDFQPDVPPFASAVILKAMSKAPANRFATMSELVTALEPYAAAPTRDPSPRSVRPMVPEAPTLQAVATKTGLDASHVLFGDPSRRRGLRRRRGAMALAAGALLAGAVALLLVRARAVRPPAPAAAPTERVTTIADLPIPPSRNPDAIDAYRAALAAYRQAAFGPTYENLTRAVALDPDLGAAHLRLAMASFFNDHFDEARQALERASLLRGSLTEHDRALLDAFEPLIARDPPDIAEHLRRAETLSRRYPKDVEVTFFYGSALFEGGDMAGAAPILERAAELDPSWAVVWAVLGQVRAYVGDLDAALADWDTCATLPATGGASCAMNRALLFAQRGECARMEDEAHRIMAKDPVSARGYALQADALASLSRPLDAVAEALRQALARAPDVVRPRLELEDRLALALYRGRFDDAEGAATDLERAVASLPYVRDQAASARAHVAIAMETGRDPTPFARDFLHRREAWAHNPRHDEYAAAADLMVPMLAVLRRAGQVSQSAFEDSRQGWLRDWDRPSLVAHYAWFQAFAVGTETPEEARVAMAALPKYQPLPVPEFGAMWAAATGRVHLLAGDAEGALSWLERAAAECRALSEPVELTRAQLDLGAAREQLGDVDGACAAYGRVVRRWGEAKPRSVTAEKARARMSALGCPR